MKIHVILLAVGYSKSVSLHHLVAALLPGSLKTGGVKEQTLMNASEKKVDILSRGIHRKKTFVSVKRKYI